jgi:hypothetical protein
VDRWYRAAWAFIRCTDRDGATGDVVSSSAVPRHVSFKQIPLAADGALTAKRRQRHRGM